MSLNTRSQLSSNQNHLCEVCSVKRFDLIFLFTLSIFIIIIHQFIFSVKNSVDADRTLHMLLLFKMCQSFNIQRLKLNLESTRPSERKEITLKRYLIRELIPYHAPLNRYVILVTLTQNMRIGNSIYHMYMSTAVTLPSS